MPLISIFAASAGVGIAVIALAASFFMRKKARAALGEAQFQVARAERMRALLGSSPYGLCINDHADGPWRIAVPPAGGDSAASLDFGDLADRLNAAGAAILTDAVARLQASGEGFSHRLAADDDRWFEFIGSRVSLPEGGHADVIWHRDVSTHEAARLKLSAAADSAGAERDMLRALLDALPVPVWHRNADLEINFVNRLYRAAMDREDGAAGMSSAGIMGEPGRALAERVRASAMAQSESHHVVIAGARRLMEFTETPLPGDRGLGGYALDFTDLEDAQGELARHVAAHAEVLERIGAGVCIYGADTRLKFFNHAFAELWDIDETWLRTEPTFAEILEDGRLRRRLPEFADFRAFKEARLAQFTSIIDQHEDMIHLPDGRTLHVTVRPHPFGGLIFVYQDVTDKLTLERSYNTLIAVQSETLKHLYEGIAVFGSDGRLKLFNPVYGRLWGFGADDLADEPHISELVDKAKSRFNRDDDWEDYRQRTIDRVMRRESASGRMDLQDGIALDYALMPLPDGATLVSYIDVTDSMHVERALRERNEALEAADQLKSEFIANISYELRTPLNVIIGFADVLANRYFGDLNERQDEYMQGILASSQLLLSMINDLLDLATIEAGYMTLDLADMNIAEALAGVAGLVRERARQKKLTIDIECAPDIGSILADERRIKQALFNLVSNSIKFTPVNGSVSLSARRINGELALSVLDTGIGIPSHDHGRVMERFERGSSALARQSGAGLGLPLVKSLIELHKGRIELDSAPDKGTRIVCYLPAPPVAKPAKKKAAAKAKP